jgi:diaminohydroxyphosphoribosylaminopyrimidine deaminase/5-amino-6-(5-phosphoribosylamino)uracil reductase
LRKRVQAILVGINTVLEDDPLLTVRPNIERQPVRVVLDSKLRIPINCKLIKTVKKTPVIVFTANKNNKKVLQLRKKGAEVVKIQADAGKCDVKAVLRKLAERDVQRILVEGGREVITSFLKRKLADEIVIYISNETIAEYGTVKASQIMKKTYNRLKRSCDDEKLFGKDVRITGV